MATYKSIIVISVTFFSVIRGLILPGPCPFLPRTNFRSIQITATVLVVVPFERHPESYLFRRHLNDTSCRSIFLESKYFHWKDVVISESERQGCNQTILAVYELDIEDLFIRTGIQMRKSPECTRSTVEKASILEYDHGFLIWSCHDEGYQAKEHDEGLIVLVKSSPFDSNDSDPEFGAKVIEMKSMVKEVVGHRVYESIEAWPGRCIPGTECPKYSCYVENRKAYVEVVIIIVVVVLAIFPIAFCLIKT